MGELTAALQRRPFDSPFSQTAECRRSSLPRVSVTAVGAANGGYFPGAWGWGAIGFLWVAGIALAFDVRVGRLAVVFAGSGVALLVWTILSGFWDRRPHGDGAHGAATASVRGCGDRRARSCAPLIGRRVARRRVGGHRPDLWLRIADAPVARPHRRHRHHRRVPAVRSDRLLELVRVARIHGTLLAIGFAARGSR